jgi:hypothetical protein
MTVDRSTILRGPGTVTRGQTFFDKDNITATVMAERWDVPTSAEGVVDIRKKDQNAKISFKPCGSMTADILAALYPYATPNIGASMFGATDTAAVVQSKAGTKITFHATALTKQPELILSAVETAFGDAEMTALVKNSTDPSTANSLFTVASQAWAAPALLSASIKTVKYTATWGAKTFTSPTGFRVIPEIQTSPIYIDGLGTVDYTLTGASIMVKCRPANFAEADFESMPAQGTAIGATLRGSNNLVIVGVGGLTVTIYNAQMVEGPLVWGATELRVGEVGFIGHRVETAGAYGALFAVGLTA